MRPTYFGCRNCGLSYATPEGYAFSKPFEAAHAKRCAIPVKSEKASKRSLLASKRRRKAPKTPQTPDWLKRVLGL